MEPTRSRGFFTRFAFWVLLGTVGLLPILFFSAFRAVKSNTNKVEDWLPPSFQETKELNWFRAHFANDQFVVVSWDGCKLGGDPSLENAEADDPRIEQLAQLLNSEAKEKVRPTSDKEYYWKYFKSAITGRRVLNQMTDEPSSIPYDEAVSRLQGSLIGPDGRQTCLIVTLTDEAVGSLRKAIGRGEAGGLLRFTHRPGLLFTAFEKCGISAADVHLGGPPVDNVAIDEEGEKTLIRLAGLSGLLGLGLSWWSLRSIKLTLIVFTCGILSGALGLAVVWLTGERMDAVLMSMPSLVYVLAISGAVHLINYYKDEVKSGGLEGATSRAIAHGWRPALLCSITTAIGLVSLYTSDLAPIRKFGIYSAVGVMGMLIVLFLYLPAAIEKWPVKRRELEAGDEGTGHGAIDYATGIDRIWGPFGGWIIRHHWLTTFGCVAVIAGLGLGLPKIRTSIDLMKLFDGKARILADYEWLEDNLGRLVPMEIVLRFPAESLAPPIVEGEKHATTPQAVGQLTFSDRMETVSQVQRAIEHVFGESGQNIVGRSMSAATFAPSADDGDSMLGVGASYARNKRLEQSRPSFEKGGYVRTEQSDDSELWRISIRLAAFKNVDYGTFVHDLRKVIDPIMAAHHWRGDILRQVAAQRANGRTAGGSVYLWDGTTAPNEQEAKVAGVVPSNACGAALRELLARDRVKVQRGAMTTESLNEGLLAQLKKLDSVVVLGDVDDTAVEKLRQAEIRLVDARREPVAAPLLEGVNALAALPSTPDVSAVYTGVVPIVYKAQRALLDSLIQSTIWSFATITPLMWWVARGIGPGSVVMLPNVLPVLVVFGGMGWLGFAVDIGSMMSASIALGVAVDDTIHFLSWFRDDLKRIGDRKQAILTAYRRCATPTLQAALISGLGLSIFAFSTFTPTQKFGWMMLTILIAGVVSELVMLPALLAGPLGKAFRIRRTEASPESSTSTELEPCLAGPNSPSAKKRKQHYDSLT